MKRIRKISAKRTITIALSIVGIFGAIACSPKSPDSTSHTRDGSANQEEADTCIVNLYPDKFPSGTNEYELKVSAAANELIKVARQATLNSNYVPDVAVYGENVSASNFDDIGRLLTSSIVGFSARLSPEAVEELKKSPLVKSVDPVTPFELY